MKTLNGTPPSFPEDSFVEDYPDLISRDSLKDQYEGYKSYFSGGPILSYQEWLNL